MSSEEWRYNRSEQQDERAISGRIPLQHSDYSEEDDCCEPFSSCIIETTISPTSVTSTTLAPLTTGSSEANTILMELQQDYENDTYFCEWQLLEHDLARMLGIPVHQPQHNYNNNVVLSLFRSVYRSGVQHALVLKALAALVAGKYTDEAIHTVAAYFCLSQVNDVTRLACIRLLVVLKSPIQDGWQVEEHFLRDTLAFVMQTSEWEFLQHSEMELLYQLRTLIQELKAGALTTIDATIETMAGTSVAVAAAPGLLQSPNKVTASAKWTANSRRSPRSIESLGKLSPCGSASEAQKLSLEPFGSLDDNTSQNKQDTSSKGAVGSIGESLFKSTRSVIESSVHMTANAAEQQLGPTAGNLLRVANDGFWKTASNLGQAVLGSEASPGKVDDGEIIEQRNPSRSRQNMRELEQRFETDFKASRSLRSILSGQCEESVLLPQVDGEEKPQDSNDVLRLATAVMIDSSIEGEESSEIDIWNIQLSHELAKQQDR